jgi:hypothetical protein
MKNHGCPLFFLLIILSALPLSADVALKPLHPDESVDQTLERRFSLANALISLDQIGEYLQSFRRLTEVALEKIPAKKMAEIGNTEWEVQELAFRNLPKDIQGALYYQNWLLKKALYELALLELKTGKIAAQKANQAWRDLKKAEKELQKFWDTMTIAD